MTATHTTSSFVLAPAMARARTATDVWHTYAVVAAAACVMIGVYWDISWHMSIGRDTFWTPAHLLVQAGGLLAGLTSGYVALETTFTGTATERAASVGFWGFRAPLGAWVCIWGCLAMVASAPFDNWWHDAYGLDVKIVSPPHAILALGIFAIAVGALLLTLAKQNRSAGGEQVRYAALYVLTGGLLVMNFGIFLTEFSLRWQQHGPTFYEVSALTYPFALVAVARGSKVRWPATGAAVVYMTVMLVLMWVIHLFPATPKLGPIYQPITHMVTLAFPVWLLGPGIAIDVVMHRLHRKVASPVLALVLGGAFVLSFAAVQWPFAGFLVHSPAARNAFFNADNWVYFASAAYVERARHFATPTASVVSMGVAVLIATASAWVGLAWGRWMGKVQR